MSWKTFRCMLNTLEITWQHDLDNSVNQSDCELLKFTECLHLFLSFSCILFIADSDDPKKCHVLKHLTVTYISSSLDPRSHLAGMGGQRHYSPHGEKGNKIHYVSLLRECALSFHRSKHLEWDLEIWAKKHESFIFSFSLPIRVVQSSSRIRMCIQFGTKEASWESAPKGIFLCVPFPHHGGTCCLFMFGSSEWKMRLRWRG